MYSGRCKIRKGLNWFLIFSFRLEKNLYTYEKYGKLIEHSIKS